MQKRFPAWLAGTGVSGQIARDHGLDNLGVTAPECAAQSHLGSFVRESAELLVGKSLTTTRQEFIDSRCDELRRGLLAGRTRLSSDQVDEAHRQFPAVGLLDVLWRLRTRSTYDDRDLHAYSANFPD